MVASTIPTALHAVSSSLTFLVPLFAFVLSVLTLSHPPTRVQNESQRRNGGRQTVHAYLAIWSLAILCTLAGAVGLKSTLGTPKGVGMEMRGRGEACVEALIFLEGKPCLTHTAAIGRTDIIESRTVSNLPRPRAYIPPSQVVLDRSTRN